MNAFYLLSVYGLTHTLGCTVCIAGSQNNEADMEHVQQQVVEQIRKIEQHPEGLLGFDPEEQERIAHWLHERSPAVIIVAERKLDRIFERRSPTDPDAIGHHTWLWAVSKTEVGAARRLLHTLFKKCQIALMIIDPSLANKPPNEIRSMLSDEQYRLVYELIGLRNALLRYCKELDCPDIADDAKSLVESEASTSIWALRYLASQREQNVDVDEFLRNKSEDPKSRLFRHPLLKRQRE